ncbi:DUF1125 domain-containing protein [Lactococcus garvieae]|uniref:DUF1125 domain-containing protein n=1 Tax=Lactococcus garvieae TaxID=1363 RepID=UPI00288F56F7|nr:hypothetical protein [Lactococcus garvieae]MDT2741984.1 hypothetical protein [Lactococcus garvieae]
MNVINLLETIAPDVEVVFKDKQNKTIIKWNQGFNTKVLDTTFQFKKVLSLNPVRAEYITVIVED